MLDTAGAVRSAWTAESLVRDSGWCLLDAGRRIERAQHVAQLIAGALNWACPPTACGSSTEQPVTTGHADGVVTIDLAEGDDPHREALRVQLAEPYRTLLGHLRHEIGHWYWTVLVQGEPEPVRALFGDERADYAAALERHYSGSPPAGWEETAVSTYATAHPWEDWAETCAHYLHIRDTLEPAAAFGLVVHGPTAVEEDSLAATPTANPKNFDEIIDTWLPLTYALNAVNRSMGMEDLYPFYLSTTVLEKLRFVHETTITGRPA